MAEPTMLDLLDKLRDDDNSPTVELLITIAAEYYYELDNMERNRLTANYAFNKQARLTQALKRLTQE